MESWNDGMVGGVFLTQDSIIPLFQWSFIRDSIIPILAVKLEE
jgi:hypothetical protein